MGQTDLLFSIVIPTRNRPGQLVACLEAVSRLEYPRGRFEVIVVDDGGSAPLAGVAEAFRDRLAVTLLAQPHGGPARARNTGAARARGRFLAFTDDDCSPSPLFLRKLQNRFAGEPGYLVGGRTANALTQNPYSTASQLLIDYLYAYYNGRADRAAFFASNNLALSAEGFREVGGFDTAYIRAAAEDREFCDRWLHLGRRTCYDPEVLVYHAHALNVRTFWRQHFTYGRGAHHFHRARRQRGEGRPELEPMSFYFRLVSYPLSQAHGPRALPLATLMLLSQAAHAVGFSWEAASQLIQSRLPWAFPQRRYQEGRNS